MSISPLKTILINIKCLNQLYKHSVFTKWIKVKVAVDKVEEISLTKPFKDRDATASKRKQSFGKKVGWWKVWCTFYHFNKYTRNLHLEPTLLYQSIKN